MLSIGMLIIYLTMQEPYWYGSICAADAAPLVYMTRFLS